MPQLQFATDTAPNGTLASDDSTRATALTYATNIHGFAELRAHVPMGLPEAFQRFDRPGLPHQRLNDGPSVLCEGRLEDLAITGDGINSTALGYSRSLSDAPYTAFWSTTSAAGFRPLTTEEVSNRSPEMYQMDTNNRIQIALTKGTTYGNGANVGGMIFQTPDKGSRQIVGVYISAVNQLPVNWIFYVTQWPAGFGAATTTTLDTGINGTQPINKLLTFTGCDYIEFGVYNNSGSAYTTVDETGYRKLTINRLRLVTATTNMVNTTLTAARAAGSGVTATVGSTANMYVGQTLHIGSSVALGEGVVITQILSGTQFVATFTSSWASGELVKAFVVYADEIAKDLVSSVSTLNPTQLSSSTVLIQSPGVDLSDESFQDQYPADILTYLAGLGDNQTTPRQWEWAVWENRALTFQPRGATARVWYIDLAAPDIERTLNALFNSVYADYQSVTNDTLRTAASTDTASVTRYGVTRRKMIGASTSSAVQAGVQVAATLADSKDPIPRAGISADAVYDANGARWPLTVVRANDIVVVRNLPPTLSATVDRVRVFRLIRTELDLFTSVLQMEPESPLPHLDNLLAQLSAGLK